jgi:23S rRNA (guanine745-N1)-methyltransferase
VLLQRISANWTNIGHESLDLHGIDIAKNAIFAAAKKQQNARFIVASTKSMPYADHYFDLLLW